MDDSTAIPLVLSGEISSGVEQSPDQFVADLYAVHANSLHRYLLLTGSRPADADELLQDAFLRLFRCLRQGEQVESRRPGSSVRCRTCAPTAPAASPAIPP
ncbi:MAG: sigma factor [Paludibaculum sp.]